MAAAASEGIAVDPALAAKAGIRKLPPSKHLTLYTDLPSSAEVDNLPTAFDAAFGQWCSYFHVNPSENAEWRMTGFLMKDKERFRQAGLLPDDLPSFRNGFSRGHNFWLYEMPSDYYRRHLLLHEGTHGYMFTLLGSCGPTWYMEGVAELLSTHQWKDGRLTLNYMPANRDEVPEWGRVRIIKDAMAQRRGMRLEGVLDYSGSAHWETDRYAWSWAAATLLDRHPRYCERFRQLVGIVRNRDFNAEFERLFATDRRELDEQWQVFVSEIEYGYDIPRAAIEFKAGHPLPARGATAMVAADRGWQSSGLELQAGESYRLTASGRYQVGTRPKPWPCEPGGVTIRYYHGQPLGILLAAVRPDTPANDKGPCAFLKPLVVGLGTTISPDQAGTLYFKINHSAAELAGNAGKLQVEVKPQR